MIVSPKVRPFRFWSQKVLPLVYDDSLSYYEVLGKVAEKLNEVIEYVTGSFKKEIETVISEYFIDIVYDSTTETITMSFEEE